MNKMSIGVMCLSVVVMLAGCEKKAKNEAMMPGDPANLSETAGTEEMAQTGESTGSAQQPIELTATTPAASVLTGAAAPAGESFEKSTVENIQKALKNASLYVGDIDGVTGPKTKKAIRDFQAQNNLNVDGKVGPKTWQMLEPYLHQDSQATTEISN